MVVQPSDERSHEPSDVEGWQEAWDFTFVVPDLSLAGYLRLAVVPEQRAAWCWAAIVGTQRRLIAVRHHELALPTGWPHEVRGEGVWCGVFCETPLDHWTIGLEAFGVAFDDATDGWGSERGELVPLGFDLEWEDDAGAETSDITGGYRRWSDVHGEVLVGNEALEITAAGWRSHTWRVERWNASPALSDADELLLVSPVLVPPHRVLRAVVRKSGESPRWEEWRGGAATAAAAAAERTA